MHRDPVDRIAATEVVLKVQRRRGTLGAFVCYECILGGERNCAAGARAPVSNMAARVRNLPGLPDPCRHADLPDSVLLVGAVRPLLHLTADKIAMQTDLKRRHRPHVREFAYCALPAAAHSSTTYLIISAKADVRQERCLYPPVAGNCLVWQMLHGGRSAETLRARTGIVIDAGDPRLRCCTTDLEAAVPASITKSIRRALMKECPRFQSSK